MSYCNRCQRDKFEDLRKMCRECRVQREKDKIEKTLSEESKYIITHTGQKIRKRYNWYEYNVSDALQAKVLEYIQEQNFGNWGFKHVNWRTDVSHRYKIEDFTPYILNNTEVPAGKVRLSCKNNGRRVFIRVLLFRDKAFGCLDLQTGKMVITNTYHWHGDGDWNFDTFGPCEDSYLDDEDSFDFDNKEEWDLEKDDKFFEIRSACDEFASRHYKIPVVKPSK